MVDNLKDTIFETAPTRPGKLEVPLGQTGRGVKGETGRAIGCRIMEGDLASSKHRAHPAGSGCQKQLDLTTTFNNKLNRRP